MRFKILLLCAALSSTGCGKTEDRKTESGSGTPNSHSENATTQAQGIAASTARNKVESEARDERSRLIENEWNAYADVVITHDASSLPDSDKELLRHLLEAGRVIDELYMLEIHPDNLKWRDMVSTRGSELDKKLYFRNQMPWCEDNPSKACIVLPSIGPREVGRVFWPEGFTADNLSSLYREINAEELLSPFTAVRKKEDSPGYNAVPFAGFDLFGPKMRKVSEELKAAAAFTENASLKKFLLSRAEAFVSLSPFPYDSSDYDWIALSSDLEITIGPYEVYKSEFQSKAMFEMIIGFENKALSAQLKEMMQSMQEMENGLAALVGDSVYKPRTLDLKSTIRAVDVWAVFGDARQSRGALLAYHLPNRGKAVNEGLYKKVILVNHAETLESVSKAQAASAIEPKARSYFSLEDDIANSAYHELAHGFGATSEMRITDLEGRLTTVKQALGEYESLFEELKAEFAALWLSKTRYDNKSLDKETLTRRYVSALVHFLGLLQYPLEDTYAQAAAVLLGQLMDQGAVGRDSDTGEFRVVFEKMGDAVTESLKEIATIQLTGDVVSAGEKVRKYLKKTENGYAAVSPITEVRSFIVEIYQKSSVKTPSLRYVVSGL